MALTITNSNTLSLLNILASTSNDQSNTMTRLSTGSKINKGADDPAGLLALKSVERELTGVNAAIQNDQRSDAMLGVADSALTQISDLLTEIQSLAAESTNSAGLTASEISTNQSQIDDAIASIDRLVRTTEFNGKKLLDGSLGINTTGADNTYFENVSVYSRDPNADSNTVRVTVNSIAHRAEATGLATTSATTDTSLEIRGRLGTQIVEIDSGENLSSVTAKINDVTALTGVYASQAGDVATAAIDLYSSGYGSAEFVKVSVIDGDTTNYNELDEEGVDAAVNVNGAAASVDGNDVYVNQNGLNLTFAVTDSFTAGTTQSFTVDDGGGATFQLGTDSTTRYTLGVDSLYAKLLGSTAAGGFLSDLKSGGTAALASDPAAAATIAAEAQKQISTLQGRIGGFQKYQVQTSLSAMNATKESLSTVKSLIGDADYAEESSKLTQQNVLLQSQMSLLSVANQQSALILSLL